MMVAGDGYAYLAYNYGAQSTTCVCKQAEHG